MEFPLTIESQDAFDEIVKDRIAQATRQARAPFADYDDFKTQAAKAAEAEATHQKALDAITQRAEAAEGWKAEREQADELAKIRDAVAQDTGVPADLLRGSSKEDFEAHASSLKPHLTAAQRLVIPGQGDEPPTGAAGSDSEERTAVRSLFGAGDTD